MKNYLWRKHAHDPLVAAVLLAANTARTDHITIVGVHAQIEGSVASPESGPALTQD